MDEEALAHCLKCARDWNTTAQHSLTAHALLRALLQSTPVATLVGLPRIKETLEALMPYTDRHFERLDRLMQASHFVSYTLASMHILLPPRDPNAPDDALDDDDDDEAEGGAEGAPSAGAPFGSAAWAAAQGIRVAYGGGDDDDGAFDEGEAAANEGVAEEEEAAGMPEEEEAVEAPPPSSNGTKKRRKSAAAEEAAPATP
eukprot:387918-Prymnesium_polylepis.1